MFFELFKNFKTVKESWDQMSLNQYHKETTKTHCLTLCHCLMQFRLIHLLFLCFFSLYLILYGFSNIYFHCLDKKMASLISLLSSNLDNPKVIALFTVFHVMFTFLFFQNHVLDQKLHAMLCWQTHTGGHFF